MELESKNIVNGLRKDLVGLPLLRLSENSGLTRQAIKKIRDGEVQNPAIDTVHKLRKAIKLTRTQLLKSRKGVRQ